MRITTKSKYGIRMLVEIAVQPEGKAAPLKAVARKLNVSEKYLEQIVIPLTRAGYLKSLRGANGGYIMGMPPQQLTAQMVIEALEGEGSQRSCIGEVGGCPRLDTCSAIDLLVEINKAISSVTTRVTVADLAARKLEKCAKMGVSPRLEDTSEEKSACNV